MPVYQYRCLNCNLQFELKQSFHDRPVADCPTCRGVARRLFSPVPILFKGPGLYVTDSREESQRRGSPEAAKKERDSGGSEK